MINYIKSESYRVTHSTGLYLMTAVMAGTVLLLNTILALGQQYIPNFRYGTFRFSLNNFTAMPFYMLVLGAVVAGCLFIDDRKNGVLKNAISYGIPRAGILAGKCLVGFLSALFALIVVLSVYVGSAFLLLKNPEWIPLKEMLTGIGAVLPSAAASLILMIILGSLCQKEISAVLWWAFIFYVIPQIFFFVGLKVEIIERISRWMPYLFLSMEVRVTYDTYQCLWDTPDGLARCLIAGVSGIVLFLACGILKFKKQEF